MGLSAAAILHDAAGNAIKVVTDGADKLLGIVSKLRNVAGTIIDPATEGKQDDAITKLTSLDGKDFATQTTLATLGTESTLGTLATETTADAIRDNIGEATASPAANTVQDRLKDAQAKLTSLDGKDFATETTLATRATQTTAAAIQTVLEAIMDTAGIKKITDPLPAGDNNIGNVDAIQSGTWTVQQGTPPWAVEGTDADGAAPTQNPVLMAGQDGTNVQTLKTNTVGRAEQVLYDGSGNPVSVVVNNTIYRLEGRSSITAPDGSVDVAVQSIDGVQHLAAGKANAIDANNGSTDQLGNGGTFVGTGTDVSQYTAVAVTIHSDKDSALSGMKFQFSQDNSNWDDTYSFEVDASESQTRRFQFPVTARYFRVNYTNGTETTTEFRCQTILHRGNLLTSIHRLGQVAHDDRSAQVMKSAIIAQREGAAVQDFYPVQADVQGNLKVTTIGADVPSDPAGLVLEFAVESGGDESMLVDGGTTPVPFTMGPTVTDEVWSLKEILLTFTADDFSFDGASFGPNLALTNGIKIEIVKDSVATTIFTVNQNEDFLRVPGRVPLVNNTGPKDVLGSVLSFDGLILSESTGDFVRLTVQDDLTSVKLKYLTATVFASRVT